MFFWVISGFGVCADSIFGIGIVGCDLDFVGVRGEDFELRS